jgi:CRP-like cAMP-binding protein
VPLHKQKDGQMCDPFPTGANLSKYSQQLLQGMGLSEARIRCVRPLLTIRSFDEGALIWARGRSVQTWNCVMTGYVAAAMPLQRDCRVALQRGGKMPLHLYGPHAWFGEPALVDGQPSDLDYFCMTPVEVIGMSQACMQESMREEPDFSDTVLKMMAWRARQHTAMLAVILTGCTSLRLVMGLAQFAQAQSMQAPEKALEGDVLDIPIGQDQIAALCCVSRTLFSAGLQQLVKAGWVKVRYGAMELQSVQAWRVFAQRQRDSPSLNSRPSMADLMSDLKRARESG